MDFIADLKNAMEANGGKIPTSFIEGHLNHPKTMVTHVRPTKNTRVCVITLATGHDLVGYATSIDAKNDVELVGQNVAYNNAKEHIWATFGSIAKVL